MRCRVLDHNGLKLAVVQRHSAGHKTPPHSVNYEAIAAGVKQLGAKACFSTAAVGTTRSEWPVGSICICTDFLDLTARRNTMFEESVQHTPMNKPYGASPHLIAAATQLNIDHQPEAVYASANGPRYESVAEVQMIKQMGGDLLGMTAATEAIVMKEARVPYGTVAVITNMGAGIQGSEPGHGEVTDVMEQRGEDVTNILLRAAEEACR
jgi:5'-methylthioadenosine phosphorylase